MRFSAKTKKAYMAFMYSFLLLGSAACAQTDTSHTPPQVENWLATSSSSNISKITIKGNKMSVPKIGTFTLTYYKSFFDRLLNKKVPVYKVTSDFDIKTIDSDYLPFCPTDKNNNYGYVMLNIYSDKDIGVTRLTYRKMIMNSLYSANEEKDIDEIFSCEQLAFAKPGSFFVKRQ